MDEITSKTNPLCTHFRKLAASRSYREARGEFLCDSPKLLGEALLWKAPVRAVLRTEGAAVPQVPAGCRLVTVNEAVMRSVSPMETPQGVVFSCALPPRTPLEIPAGGPGRRYLLLDGVQDPGNVGTILRTADAFGWTAVLLPGCADPYGPKTVRAAMGVHFRRAVCRETLERAAGAIRGAGLPLYAAALAENTLDLRQASLSACGVIIGSEGRGVSREALALCDRTVRIPMRETCESLNAAAAAAVVLWEGSRGEL